jgi:predicted transcriptional regulator
MRNALPANKHKEMIDLLEQGYTVDVVSNWLGVIPEYVSQYSKDIISITDETLEEDVIDPYKDFEPEDFLVTDIKQFRKYVQDNIDCTLLSNSKLSHILSVYKKHRGNE